MRFLGQLTINASASCPRIWLAKNNPLPQSFTQFTPEAQDLMYPIGVYAVNGKTGYGIIIFLRLKEVLKYLPEVQVALVTSYNRDTGRQIGLQTNQVYFPTQSGSEGYQYRVGRSDFQVNASAYISTSKWEGYQNFNSLDEFIEVFNPDRFMDTFLFNNDLVTGNRFKELMANNVVAKKEIMNNCCIAYFTANSYPGWSAQSIFIALTDGNFYKYQNWRCKFFAYKNQYFHAIYNNNQYWTGSGANTPCPSWTLSINGSEPQDMPVITTSSLLVGSLIPDIQRFSFGKRDNISKEYIETNSANVYDVGSSLDFKQPITIPNAKEDNEMCNKATCDKIINKELILRGLVW